MRRCWLGLNAHDPTRRQSAPERLQSGFPGSRRRTDLVGGRGQRTGIHRIGMGYPSGLCPHHDESDSTVQIGGLTRDDIYDVEPLPPLSGISDYYTCVSLGYELLNSLSLVDGMVLLGPKPSKTIQALSAEEKNGENWE